MVKFVYAVDGAVGAEARAAVELVLAEAAEVGADLVRRLRRRIDAQDLKGQRVTLVKFRGASSAHLVRVLGRRVDEAVTTERGPFPLLVLIAPVRADLCDLLRRRVDLEHLPLLARSAVNAPVFGQHGTHPLIASFAQVRPDRRGGLRVDVNAQHLREIAGKTSERGTSTLLIRTSDARSGMQ